MKPVDYVVLILVVCVVITTTIPLLMFAITGEHASPENSKMVGGLIASIVAIVSIYVGAKLRDKDDG